MEITKKILKETDVVDEILCNKCGKSCRFYMDKNHKYGTFNYATITSEYGYGSSLDGMEFEAHICTDCYLEIEKTFKIKPDKKWGLI